MKLSVYNQAVEQSHKTKTVQGYFKLYAWIWFHFEFWVYPVELRRPFTFFMRDWLYTHKIAFAWATLVFYGGTFTMAYWNRVGALLLCFVASMLLGHLIWGECWKQGEQEDPPYKGI
jgi:hypothetical protein